MVAETAKYTVENQMGCGLFGTFFKQRKTILFERTPHMKKQLDSSKAAKNLPSEGNRPEKIVPINPKSSKGRSTYRASSGAARSSTSSASNNSKEPQAVSLSNRKQLKKEPTFNSNDWSITVSDQRKHSGDEISYRASSGNVMLLGHLGNLKKQGKEKPSTPKTNEVAKENMARKSTGTTNRFGNILNYSTKQLNPDVIKSLGNEKYKQGKYDEALELYDQAIAVDPSKACYYSNKSAALMGLGRLLEAVINCREAVRIDSSYHNAHYRLAKLYLRLGEAEKSLWHYKCSGRKASTDDVAQAQALEKCMDRCKEARAHGEWSKLVDESRTAFSLGADSAPQIYAMKAEAMLKLHRHQEAFTIVHDVLQFSVEVYGNVFGSSVTADLLVVRALVYMANGRFEDAVAAVQQALQLDSSHSVKLIDGRVKLVASARLNGNRLFKGSRFTEALTAYNTGLEKDPYNSVLLCNRAACRSKLGHYEKAVEDCTAALILRPSYTKARLRRANCNAELEKWKAAIQDYEVLMQEIPGDLELKDALEKAKKQLTKMHSCHSKGISTLSI